MIGSHGNSSVGLLSILHVGFCHFWKEGIKERLCFSLVVSYLLRAHFNRWDARISVSWAHIGGCFPQMAFACFVKKLPPVACSAFPIALVHFRLLSRISANIALVVGWLGLRVAQPSCHLRRAWLTSTCWVLRSAVNQRFEYGHGACTGTCLSSAFIVV